MALLAPHLSLEQLRGLIGTRVRHEGAVCEIIEVLEDGPAVILQQHEPASVIQADMYGEAHRRVPPTKTIMILSPDGSGYSPAFLALELLEESAGANART